MKASELIAKLQAALNEYGDMDAMVRDTGVGDSWAVRGITPDPPTPMEFSEGEDGTIDIIIFEEEP